MKEYFPGDVTRDEIEEMVLSAVGDSLVKEINFKKGVNLTMEHAQAIIDLLYMNINETNNGDKNYEKILEGVKLKIGFLFSSTNFSACSTYFIFPTSYTYIFLYRIHKTTIIINSIINKIKVLYFFNYILPLYV